MISLAKRLYLMRTASRCMTKTTSPWPRRCMLMIYFQWDIKNGWIGHIHSRLETKFGKITRKLMPFTHLGCEYVRLKHDCIFVNQDAYLDTIKAPVISKKRASEEQEFCDKEEIHQYRSLCCQLLHLLHTRWDISAAVTQLQSKQTKPTILDMKTLIQTLDRAKRNRQGMGLYFHRLQGPLKLTSITDASHATKMTSYAHEAQGLFLCEDRPVAIHKNGQLDVADYQLFLGKAHPLSGTSKKGKRISYSTSHAELFQQLVVLKTLNMLLYATRRC